MRNNSNIARPILVIVWIAGSLLAGCGGATKGELPPAPTVAEQSAVQATPQISIPPTSPPISGGGFQSGEAAQWPDYIPGDIPVLEGEIEMVMEGGSHVRLFYDNVSEKQVIDYLEMLESMGFALEYRVYVQEGFPDNSEEKMAQGEFDDVDIRKGEYHMTITYGADPTYDIYLSGFEEEAIAATTLQWSPELPESVPQPQNCVLQSIDPWNDDEFHITCKKEGEGVEEAYLQLLEDSGFEEKNGTTLQNMVIETTVFENEEAVVLPNTGFSPTFFTIQVYRKIEPESLPWPEELMGIVPQPERCILSMFVPVSPGKYMISCSAPDENVLPDYLSLLSLEGFEETVKFVGENDVIQAVTMEKETGTVQIMNSGNDSSFSITVTIGQP